MVFVFVGGPRVGFSMTNIKLCIPLGIKYIDRPTPTTTIFVHFLQERAHPFPLQPPGSVQAYIGLVSAWPAACLYQAASMAI